MKFKKKPIVIEAERVPHITPVRNFQYEVFRGWSKRVGFIPHSERKGVLVIETLEGLMTAEPGDWIIKGVEGEFYPCKNSVFMASYEDAE